MLPCYRAGPRRWTTGRFGPVLLPETFVCKSDAKQSISLLSAFFLVSIFCPGAVWSIAITCPGACSGQLHPLRCGACPATATAKHETAPTGHNPRVKLSLKFDDSYRQIFILLLHKIRPRHCGETNVTQYLPKPRRNKAYGRWWDRTNHATLLAPQSRFRTTVPCTLRDVDRPGNERTGKLLMTLATTGSSSSDWRALGCNREWIMDYDKDWEAHSGWETTMRNTKMETKYPNSEPFVLLFLWGGVLLCSRFKYALITRFRFGQNAARL